MTEKKIMWNKEWPKEQGWYWYFGRRFSDFEIELIPIQAIKVSNGFAYIAGSHFMYKAEGAEGMFYPMEYPPHPDEQWISVASTDEA